MPTVRTRFAPSPTGYMHIGGMRTALFNWLWARHNGGQFILRIDDTDQERNIDAALDPILNAFRWLGLDWDEGPEIGGPYGPYFQSQRLDKYRQACDQLLAAGLAYKDFDPPAVAQADRQAAEQAKRPYLNVRRSLELTPAQRDDLEQRGEPYVIRYLIDRTRKVAIDDRIRGHVEWDCGLMPDPVIMRSSGMPLYNFASVVDDAALQITHVIRAEEHLTNTAVQALLFESLGHALPEFAHIPFVAAPGTKEKLSKREKNLEKYRKSPQFKKLFDIADDVLPKIGMGSSATLNPVMVSYYDAVGFLPDAVFNGLSRLGWSLDDKTENMSRDFIVEHFTLDRVVKGPAGLDPDKLLSYQEYWMGQLPLEEKVRRCRDFLVRAGLLNNAQIDDVYLTRVVSALNDRLKLCSDILSYDEYFVADDQMTYDEKGFDKRLRQAPRSVELLRKFLEVLQQTDDFTASALETEFKAWMEREQISYGEIIHALRIAVSGKTAGPGMFECLELLGKERAITRIQRTLQRLVD
ncbi:glutamate--tRNA ligase [Planctomicrobium sp. SH664]|uniref:glutamate--tRNA ligase n=1 Tax=Planctomicrobium sp. SH664 TaxID=3448125 RepID=UPI003F5BAE80